MDWHIITGEYPPQPGGVSDYTQSVAHALVEAGDRVHVWAPACLSESVSSKALVVHRLPGHFGRRSLRHLTAGLATFSRPRPILLQYVPYAFGWKGMNLPFCNWLCNYAKHDPLWTMFHEVAFISRDNWKQHIVATVTQMMARRIAKASERNFVSTIAWIPLMRSIGIEGREPKWLPIPSSIPINNDSRMVTAIRDALGINSNPERRIVGHFGTFGGLVWSVLQPVLARILRDLPNIIIQLIGRGSQSARAKLGHYDDMSRVVAADDLGAVEVASRIQSCDLMVQPFTDGVNLRRTSVLSSMKLNTAIVSNVGHNTEPVWSNERLVGLTSSLDPTEMFTLVKQLLNDEEARMSYARRAHSYYHRTCEMEAIVKILKEEIT